MRKFHLEHIRMMNTEYIDFEGPLICVHSACPWKSADVRPNFWLTSRFNGVQRIRSEV